MSEAKPCSTPFAIDTKLDSEDSELFDQPTVYKSILGALQYLTLSKPDKSFVVNKLSQFLLHFLTSRSIKKFS